LFVNHNIPLHQILSVQQSSGWQIRRQRSKKIKICGIDKAIVAFYVSHARSDVANTFHAKEWEYVKGLDRELLMMN